MEGRRDRKQQDKVKQKYISFLIAHLWYDYFTKSDTQHLSGKANISSFIKSKTGRKTPFVYCVIFWKKERKIGFSSVSRMCRWEGIAVHTYFPFSPSNMTNNTLPWFVSYLCFCIQAESLMKTTAEYKETVGPCVSLIKVKCLGVFWKLVLKQAVFLLKKSSSTRRMSLFYLGL